MTSPGIYGRFVAQCPDGVQCVWCRGGNASISAMLRVQKGKFACVTHFNIQTRGLDGKIKPIWTFLNIFDCVTDDFKTYLQKIDTENVLRYRKFILKCWYSVPVCVKLGRNTEKQRKKSDKFDKLPLWGTGNIHMLYQSEMYLSKCQIF